MSVRLSVRGCSDPGCPVCRVTPAAEAYREQVSAAGMDLALWSRSWAESVRGAELASLVMGELAALYLDEGRTEADIVAAVQFAFRSVKAARETLAADDHPPEG